MGRRKRGVAKKSLRVLLEVKVKDTLSKTADIQLPLDDMNLDVPVADARRIEVVANGLALCTAASSPSTPTLVSPFNQ